MKLQTTILLLLIGTNVYGQSNKQKQYCPQDYPEAKYSVKLDTFFLKSFTIYLIQAKLNDDKYWDSTSAFCRVWLTVKEGTRIVDNLFYADCEAVGGCSGVFYDYQPNKDFLIFSKFGDYNGQLIIVDSTGKIQKFLGGRYYLSNNLEYIFSIYDSDISGLTVFDLQRNELVFSSGRVEDYLADFYFLDNMYFAVVGDDVKMDNQTNILTFDFAGKKLKKSTVDDQYIQKAKRLNAYNRFTYAPCSCGQTK